MVSKQKKMTGSIGKAYQYLFENIIYNRLTAGTVISESEIAANLGISRTPVREALTILESEGIITRYPMRGCFVSHIAVRDVEEIFELRMELERCALRNSISRISDADLDMVEEKIEALSPDMDDKEYYDSDRTLHGLILNYSGNNRLIDFLGILNAQIERVRVISASKPRRLTQSRREHLAMVNAIRARDLPLAEQCLIEHIGNVRDSTIDVCKYMNMAYA